jgi:formylglycine-generating enzyme required for sulfatase activity
MKYEIAPKSSEVHINWADALEYCDSLTIDGKTGWRLPTKEELHKIYESDEESNEIYFSEEELNDIHESKNRFIGKSYWSSTRNYGYSAWCQEMYSGYQFYSNRHKHCYVRAIRDLKDD